MSDIVRKMVTISDDVQHINTGYKERRFKKAVSLKLKIGSIGHTTNASATPTGSKPTDSFSALEELVQCGICLDRLSHPRMLPCQHTFCLSCLKTHLTAKNLKIVKNQNASNNKNPMFTMEKGIKSMTCPMCQSTIQLPEGIDSLDKFPKNLYLQSLLKVVQGSPVSPHVTENFRCVNCQMVSAQQEQVCQHCMQIFCHICWNEHLAEMESNLSLISKQLNESENRMRHKLDNFSTRCETLEEKIKKVTRTRIENILGDEKRVLGEVASIKKEGAVASDILLCSISKLKDDIDIKSRTKSNNHKVTSYINLHRETSKILEQVNYFGEARLTFDPENFKVEQLSEGIYNDEEDSQQIHNQVVSDPFESCESMAKHYKSRSFNPKLVWNKCPRPAGLGIPPWDDSKLYIAATDSHNVLIVDRNKFKLIDRLSHPDMICPSGLAFSPPRKEVFVSDKWKQCIHVFSIDGEYLRNICGQRLRGPDGLAMDPNDQLIVCDTGNNRVLLIDPVTGEKLGTIGAHNGLTQLNFPTSVSVHGSKIIVADSGNNRIKIYNINGDLLQEIGSFGKNPGQFRSAEVVAIDQLGFILVGDAGNARVQVFKPDGTLVKIFGSKSGFGWVSGILVTPELDIITSDSKTRSLRIF